MMWQKKQKKQFSAITTCVLMLAGCGGRSKKSDTALVSSKVVFDEREKSALLSGISKRCATSSLLLKELGELCIDIPIPLDAYELASVKRKLAEQDAERIAAVSPVGTDSADENHSISVRAAAQVSYISYKSVADLVSFYMSQMERFGWQFDADFQAEEVLLLFSKPDKRAAVSVRTGKKNCSVVIFVS